MNRPNRNAAIRPALSSRDPVPKIVGADVEVGNFIAATESSLGTGHLASRRLLREIAGIPQSSWSASNGDYGSYDISHSTTDALPYGGYTATSSLTTGTGDYSSEDWGRKFLATNGGCVYIDLNHLELCTPEVTSAYDYVAAWHAMLLDCVPGLGAGQRSMLSRGANSGVDQQLGWPRQFVR